MSKRGTREVHVSDIDASGWLASVFCDSSLNDGLPCAVWACFASLGHVLEAGRGVGYVSLVLATQICVWTPCCISE